MADEEPRNDDSREESTGEEPENNRPDDTLAKDKKCPECGEPVDDVRATCINCGYEYKDEDHEDPDAGSDFVSGTQVDEDGNELPDEGPEAEAAESSEDESEQR